MKIIILQILFTVSLFCVDQVTVEMCYDPKTKNIYADFVVTDEKLATQFLAALESAPELSENELKAARMKAISTEEGEKKMINYFTITKDKPKMKWILVNLDKGIMYDGKVEKKIDKAAFTSVRDKLIKMGKNNKSTAILPPIGM